MIALAAIVLAVTGPAAAHPSRGIAVTPDGKLYFSDLTRIWRIDGTRLHLVRDNRGHHTHALAVDASGQLVWEESDYDPDRNRYLETVWELTPRGPARRFGPLFSPPMGLGIVRDSAGCTWRADQPSRDAEALVYRKCPRRTPQLMLGRQSAASRFRPTLINDVGGALLDRRGRFVFRQGTTVRAIDAAGRMTILATGISQENFGIALDRTDALLVTEFDNRRLIRIKGGQRHVVARSPMGWAPTGVAVGLDGTIHVLEASIYRRGQQPRVQVRALTYGRPPRLLARVTLPA